MTRSHVFIDAGGAMRSGLMAPIGEIITGSYLGCATIQNCIYATVKVI